MTSRRQQPFIPSRYLTPVDAANIFPHTMKSTIYLGLNLATFILAGFILATNVAAAQPAAVADIDTALTQRPEAPRKNFGDYLLDAPETVLRVPLYVGKGLNWAVVHGIYRNPAVYRVARRVFSFKSPSGIIPAVSYGTNPGLRYGFEFVKPQAFSPQGHLRIISTYSTHSYHRHGLSYRAPQLFSSRSGLDLEITYRRRPRENFYGLGNDTHESDKVAYTTEWFEVKAMNRWLLAQNITVGVIAAYRATNIYGGKTPDLTGDLDDILEKFDLRPADLRRSRVLSGGLSFDHDWRNERGQPTAGGRELVELIVADGIGKDEDVRFTRASLELTQYLNLYHKRVLALKLLAESVDADKELATIPFYLKSRLGGRDDLRGFVSSRYVDYDRVQAVLEYRYPIWDVIDAFIFAEAGRVFAAIGDEFTLRNWHEGYGTGLRLWNESGVALSVQVARSDEGWRVYFEMGGDW